MTEEARYSYRLGSRAEGVAVYDEGTRLFSFHDSDPCRGSANSFDAVRLHKFGDLDAGLDPATPMTERPSFKAMVELASADPKVQAEIARGEFEDLGEAPRAESEFKALDPAGIPEDGAPLSVTIGEIIREERTVRWLKPDELERGVSAILAGPRSTYKSALAMDFALHVAAVLGEPVLVLSAEGRGVGNRVLAWLREHRPDVDPDALPLHIVERRFDLSSKDELMRVHQECARIRGARGRAPSLIVIDTLSKFSGAVDENDNSEIKELLSQLDRALRQPFDAAVLIVTHTGHGDATRARGASALEADTDACYIVSKTRSGTVRLTRERFKDSPELPPLEFRPRVVDLGRVDGSGKPVTSIVLDRCEPEHVSATKAPQPRGANQTLLLRALREMTADGSSVSVADLLDHAQDLRPRDGAKEPPRGERNNLRVSLEAMIGARLVLEHPDKRVSQHGPVVLPAEDFLS